MAPVNGHAVGEHRSRPAVVGDVVVQVCQTPAGGARLVFAQGGSQVSIPLGLVDDATGVMAELLDEARQAD